MNDDEKQRLLAMIYAVLEGKVVRLEGKVGK